MIEQSEKGSREGYGRIESIRVLLFEAMGTRMGVDVEQTAGMLDPRDESVSELSVLSFNEKTFCRKGSPQYVEPMVVLVKDTRGKHGLLIDQPEDIVNVRTESIRPLPALIESTIKSRAVWGVALIDEEMVLLVDLLELIAPVIP